MANGAFAAAQRGAFEFKPIMYMQEYLDEIEAQGRTENYQRTVRTGLHHFARYLRGQDIVSPEEITRPVLIRFQAWCNEQVTNSAWARSTSVQVLKKARAWINWMADLGYISSNPWRQIKLPMIEKQPNPLSDEEFSLLMHGHQRDAFRIDPFTFHRRETLLCLLYAWGLRIHELEALTVADMDMRNDFILAINKGGRKKSLPYTPQIKAVVNRWLAVRPQHAEFGVDALLITVNGTAFSKGQVYTTVSELAKSVGLHVNPHRLRDTMGTHLLDDDTPIERVQKIYGHSNRRSTLAYAKINDKKLFQSVEESMDPRLRNLFANTRDLRPT